MLPVCGSKTCQRVPLRSVSGNYKTLLEFMTISQWYVLLKFDIIHCHVMQYFNLVWFGLIIHWFIDSLIHWFIDSLIHWFIDSVSQSVSHSFSTNSSEKRYCRSIIQYLLPHMVSLFHWLILVLLQNWLAFENLHRPLFKEHQEVDFPNDVSPSQRYNYAFCKVSIIYWLNLELGR